MHDCTADQDAIKMVNRTFELIQLLVPELDQQDYKFVRLDEIPGLAPAAQPDPGSNSADLG
jgi:hypothetical protein